MQQIFSYHIICVKSLKDGTTMHGGTVLHGSSKKNSSELKCFSCCNLSQPLFGKVVTPLFEKNVHFH